MRAAPVVFSMIRTWSARRRAAHHLDPVRLVVRHLRGEVGLELGRGFDRALDQAVVLHVVDRGRAVELLELGRPALVLAERALEPLEPRLGQPHLGAVAVEDLDLVEPLADQPLLELELLLEVAVVGPDAQLVERRLGDVDVALLDQLLHVPEEERQYQRADVGAVDVGVAGDDDLVVAGTLDVELLADARADRGDHRLDLVVGEHLVDARLLDVDDLAAQRQDRLEAAVAGVDGRAAGAVALDQEELGGAGSVIEQSASLPGRPPPTSAVFRRMRSRAFRAAWRARLAAISLLTIGLRLGRVLLEVLGQLRVADRLDEPADRRVAELGLGLALELRLAQLHRDDRGQALTESSPVSASSFSLRRPFVAGVVVQGAGQRRLEAGEVRAALVGVDVVGERVGRLDVASRSTASRPRPRRRRSRSRSR